MQKHLRLTRAHTVPLEAIPAVVGGLFATGGEVTVGVVLWGLAGVMYHLTGYGMNSYIDWKKGYDKDDPHKQHHPLNTDSMTADEAGSLVTKLMLATFLMFLWLAYPSPVALLAVVVGITSGIIYNQIGKMTHYKFIFISVAHTTVFVAPYLALGGEFTYTFFLGALYVFLWVAFQISVSGEVKDIMQDEANFLKDKLNTQIYTSWSEKDIWFSAETYIYAIGLKTLNIIVAIALYIEFAGLDLSPTATIAYFLLAFALWGAVGGIIGGEEYQREKRVKSMAIVEMITLYLFLLAFQPFLGWGAVITLMVLATLWVLVFNRIQWGTLLAPDV